MRSVVSAACLMSLAALLLTACGPSPDSSPSTSPPVTAPVIPSASAPAGGRPNVILLVLDDLDLATLAGVPVLADRLAAGGTTFSNAFVTDPRCCPSRVSILTGQYLHNHGVLTNTLPLGGFGRFHADGGESSTLATWLASAGYRTALVGKYLNGYPSPEMPESFVPPGWTDWHAVVGDLDYFGYRLIEDGQGVRYGSADADYLTDVLAERAASVIEAAAADGRPLFMLLAPFAPHLPSTPAARHAGELADARAPRGPAFNESDMSDKPEWMQGLRALVPRNVARFDELYRARMQTLLAVGDMLDRLDQALEAAGVADETYLIFTSDNGYHAGQHRLPAGKATPYEEDIRVPLIISGPAAGRGATSDALVSLVDLAPTIAALVGLETPPDLDGRSLVPLLSGVTPPDWRSAILVEHGGPELIGARTPAYAAIRTATEMYVEYAGGDRELYDLEADPFQLENLIATADANRVATLSAWLDALRSCAGPGCLAADSPN